MSKINLPALKRAIEALFTPHQLATNPALSVHMASGGVVPLGSLAQLPEVSAHLQVCEINFSYLLVNYFIKLVRATCCSQIIKTL